MSPLTSAVIVDAVRTPSGRGKPGGALSGVHPVDLLAGVLRAIRERNGLAPDEVEDVLIGCVSQVGEQSTNIARQAVLAAGFDERVPAATIDRQCGSSQQALHFAAQGVMAGAYDVVLAGGVESMSRVPLGAAASTAGSPVSPLLHDRYPDGLVHQGVSAELIAQRWGLDREALDSYSAGSHLRAARAAAEGAFDTQIIPVATPSGIVGHDETIRAETSPEGLAALVPAFRTEALAQRFPDLAWSVTAGSSSPLTDGASAVLVMSEERASRLGLTPRARIRAFSVVGDDPMLMLTGPIPATQRVLERAGLRLDDIDAYEVNEAFAPVPLAWAAELGADPARLNPGEERSPSGTHSDRRERGSRAPCSPSLRPRAAATAADDVRGRRDGERDDHRAHLMALFVYIE